MIATLINPGIDAHDHQLATSHGSNAATLTTSTPTSPELTELYGVDTTSMSLIKGGHVNKSTSPTAHDLPNLAGLYGSVNQHSQCTCEVYWSSLLGHPQTGLHTHTHTHRNPYP